MIIRATITSPSDALIPNKIVRTKVVTLKFGSDINILDAPPAGSITGTMLQDGAVKTSKLAEEAVTSSKIAKGAVDTEQLADNAVTTGKIEPGAVDWDRLDYDTQQAIIAGGGGTGGGIPDAIAAALRDKYNKAGGRISGTATVGGELKAERSIHADNDVVADRDITAKRRMTAKELDVTTRAAFGGNAQSAIFAQGPAGTGWNIDSKGNGELHSLVLRMFLETPELRKNKISVIGDEFWVTAAGLVDTVKEASKLPVYTKAGRQIMGKDGKPWMLNVGKGYVLRFKLEEGDVHTFKKDDILVSKFAQESGFQTAWFRVKYVLSDKEVFVSALNGYAPQVAMSVARQGNFTDPERQNSICIDGRNGYMRVLSGVDSTKIRFENIRCQYGNLNGLTVPGIGSLHGYGEYSDNAYKKGVILMQGGQTVEDFVQKAVNEVAANVEGIVNEVAANMEGVTNGLRDLQSSLGGLAFKDRVEKSLLGDTIISGGFIKSGLIAVDDALVERLIASDAFIAKLTTSEAFIDRLVARSINTQADPNNPRRVEIAKGGEDISIYNQKGEPMITIRGNEGIYLQKDGYMTNIQANEMYVGYKYPNRTYPRLDEVGLRFSQPDGGVNSQYSYNDIRLPENSAIRIGKGSTIDMPGVLAAGRVSKVGRVDAQWGCKSCKAYKHNGQTGKYKITHDIGHTNYFIQATPAVADNTWAKVHAIILEKAANYAVVAIYDSGTNNNGVDADFEFLIVGDK